METIINDIKTFGIDIGLKLLCGIIIIVIGFNVVKIIEKQLKKGKALDRMDQNVKTFITSFITVALKVIVLIMAATTFGVPMTSIVTLIGTISLAIGLALQGGLSNIAGGIMILIFKPFKSGDYIKAIDCEGTVNGITLFYTILTTYDNKRVMLPNGELSNKSIINYTTLTKRRLDIDFDVSYNTDIKKVKKVINNIVAKQETVLQDEDIFVRLTNQKDSSLVFSVRVWVNQEDYWSTKFDLLEQIKEAFDKNHIEIPYNQLDVHVKK